MEAQPSCFSFTTKQKDEDAFSFAKCEWKKLGCVIFCSCCDREIAPTPMKTLPCLHSVCGICFDEIGSSLSPISSSSSDSSSVDSVVSFPSSPSPPPSPSSRPNPFSSQKMKVELSEGSSLHKRSREETDDHDQNLINQNDQEERNKEDEMMKSPPQKLQKPMSSLDQDKEIFCDECRSAYLFSRNSKATPKENPFLDSLVPKLRLLQLSLDRISGQLTEPFPFRLCEVCPPPNQIGATHFCSRSNLNLCEFHHNVQPIHPDHFHLHDSLDLSLPSSSSSLLPPKIIGESPSTQDLPRCLDHPFQSLSHFCFTCNACVCLECVSISHSHHQITTISEAHDLKRREMLELSEQCSAFKPALRENAMQVKLIRDAVSERAKFEKGHYVNQMDFLIANLPALSMRLETIKQVFVSEIEFQSRMRDNHLEWFMCLWLDNLEWLDDASRFINLISSRAPPHIFFRFFDMMKTRLSTLKDTASSFQFAETLNSLDMKMRQPFDLTLQIQNVSAIINQHTELQIAFESLPQSLTSVQINGSS